MVQLVRKSALPQPDEVPAAVRRAAERALTMTLRQPTPAGALLLFTSDMQLIEPVADYLREHGVQRAHTLDTLRTYAEILYDWFETLEQNAIRWHEADAVDLVRYRNRMMQEPSCHTQRPYCISTINHRVRGVLRFYDWAVRTGRLSASELANQACSFALARRPSPARQGKIVPAGRSMFVLRQFERLPDPLTSGQARELLAQLLPPYDLMARWQLYTGLRVSELLRVDVEQINKPFLPSDEHHTIDVMRKGRKPGYVIAPATLLDETKVYLGSHRHAWLVRARRRGRQGEVGALFVNARGAPVSKSAYQRVISDSGARSGFKATTHLLRATFACMLLARLEHVARQGAPINPLMIVKVLMGHERLETTDRYLRAIAADATDLKEILDQLIPCGAS